jgi:hypothetical protein
MPLFTSLARRPGAGAGCTSGATSCAISVMRLKSDSRDFGRPKSTGDALLTSITCRIECPMLLEFVRGRSRQAIEVREQGRVRHVHRVQLAQRLLSNLSAPQHDLGNSIRPRPQHVLHRIENPARIDERPRLSDESPRLEEWFTDGNGIARFPAVRVKGSSRKWRSHLLVPVRVRTKGANRRRVHCPHRGIRRARLQRKECRHVRRPREVQQPRRRPMVLHDRHPAQHISDRRWIIQVRQCLPLKHVDDALFLGLPVARIHVSPPQLTRHRRFQFPSRIGMAAEGPVPVPVASHPIQVRRPPLDLHNFQVVSRPVGPRNCASGASLWRHKLQITRPSRPAHVALVCRGTDPKSRSALA